eukprot:3626217-Pleurochrysis_carterae.AAC.3
MHLDGENWWQTVRTHAPLTANWLPLQRSLVWREGSGTARGKAHGEEEEERGWWRHVDEEC